MKSPKDHGCPAPPPATRGTLGSPLRLPVSIRVIEPTYTVMLQIQRQRAAKRLNLKESAFIPYMELM